MIEKICIKTKTGEYTRVKCPCCHKIDDVRPLRKGAWFCANCCIEIKETKDSKLKVVGLDKHGNTK